MPCPTSQYRKTSRADDGTLAVASEQGSEAANSKSRRRRRVPRCTLCRLATVPPSNVGGRANPSCMTLPLLSGSVTVTLFTGSAFTGDNATYTANFASASAPATFQISDFARVTRKGHAGPPRAVITSHGLPHGLPHAQDMSSITSRRGLREAGRHLPAACKYTCLNSSRTPFCHAPLCPCVPMRPCCHVPTQVAFQSSLWTPARGG